ncbi:ASCH domain-containing protein [Dyadobacter sp. OTU695]|uniref:ASCH domain-containing protein n=1 Tax=Dyadobacter sp. OTU695 TaxID=3043860 RepID=UPI00313A9E27
MKAISVQQPWAGLLVLGIKKCETRSWNTKFRGKIAIHASAKMPKEGEALLKELCELLPDTFFKGSRAYNMCTVLGCVLGRVQVEDCRSTNDMKPVNAGEKMLGDFSANRYYWWCINPEAYLTPIPAVGQLSIWEWEDNQERV